MIGASFITRSTYRISSSSTMPKHSYLIIITDQLDNNSAEVNSLSECYPHRPPITCSSQICDTVNKSIKHMTINKFNSKKRYIAISIKR